MTRRKQNNGQIKILTNHKTAIRYVLLDAVGTLIHVRPSVAEAYWQVGSRHGSQLAVNDIRSRFETAFARNHDGGATCEDRERERWRTIVCEVLSDLSHAGEIPFQELWELFAQPEQWSLFPDVDPVWQQLKTQGFQIGIASNFDSRLRPICDALPPLHRADFCFVSSEVGFPKPHPEFYRRVQQALGASSSEILLVGDSFSNDVEGARQAGWQAIHLERNPMGKTGSVTHESISSLMELLDWLEGSSSGMLRA